MNIRVPRSCSCGEMHDQTIELNARFGRPSIEKTIPTGNGGSIRADVAVEKEGKIQLVIEIEQTNAVDRDKIKKLGDIPWIEVKASDVLEGGLVKVINSGNMKPLVKCPSQPKWEKFPKFIGSWEDYGARTPPPEFLEQYFYFCTIYKQLRSACKATENGTHNWHLQVIRLNKYHPRYENGVVNASYRYFCASCGFLPYPVWYVDYNQLVKGNISGVTFDDP